MRTAVIVGGIVVAGCLGALGAVEAEKLNALWPKLVGGKTTTTAAAPAETARPAGPRPMVSDVGASTAAPSAQAAPAPAPATQVAAGPKPTPAAAAPAAPPPSAAAPAA